MSQIFGPIRQNGYVVRDLEAAMRHWTDVMGVGPFTHMPHVRPDDFVYRGRSSSPECSIAIAFSGDLQIELIQVHSDTPNLWKDFLDAGREGLQHVSAWTDDFDAAFERITAAGHRCAQQGTIPGGIRFAYFDTEAHPGTVFEISNLDAEPYRSAMAALCEVARTWDGSEPVRKATF
jgi:catechol 2,3-dioxygenase-like lactoylglutathione lyase family enzyme